MSRVLISVYIGLFSVLLGVSIGFQGFIIESRGLIQGRHKGLRSKYSVLRCFRGNLVEYTVICSRMGQRGAQNIGKILNGPKVPPNCACYILRILQDLGVFPWFYTRQGCEVQGRAQELLDYPGEYQGITYRIQGLFKDIGVSIGDNRREYRR